MYNFNLRMKLFSLFLVWIQKMAYSGSRKEGCLFATKSNPFWRRLPGELRARILSGGKFQDYGTIFDTQDVGFVVRVAFQSTRRMSMATDKLTLQTLSH